MAKIGAFTFVLHSHLPYARQAGMWPHGEEWVHEAMADTYVPILDGLFALREAGVPFHLTIGITPILAEQLNDQLIIENFIAYAAQRAAWAATDVTRFEQSGETALRDVARFYHHWYARVLTSFQDGYQRNILGAFKVLQDEGLIEIATSAATHAYLPLVSRDSTIHAQLAVGMATYERHFGRPATAAWLPECAYRPSVEEGSNGATVRRPGIETFLAAAGLEVFFSETHTVEGGAPVGKAAGEAIGPYAMIPRRYAMQVNKDVQLEPGTTFQPYWVGDAAGQVAVLGRNERTGKQVWSGTYGYPGDFAYREFHRKDGVSGLQYWRIGGKELDLGEKPPYEPDIAQQRVRDHADHFVGLIEELLGRYHAETGKFGVISSAYDTELFGHWWFEGADWLKAVLERLAKSATVELASASAMVEEHRPTEVLALPESSWGAGGNHFTWLNVDTQWMWPVIHRSELRMEQLVERFPDADGTLREMLNQAARELLLLESSDWPFLVTTGQAKDYATQRFTEHVERFDKLAEAADALGAVGGDSPVWVDELRNRDNPFPTIDYRVFAERQGRAD